MFKGVLTEESGIDDFSINEFYEFHEQFKARISRQELIQKPYIMTAC